MLHYKVGPNKQHAVWFSWEVPVEGIDWNLTSYDWCLRECHSAMSL
jgi:hypothetical protein